MKTLKFYVAFILVVTLTAISCVKRQQPKKEGIDYDKVNMVWWREDGVLYHNEPSKNTFMPTHDLICIGTDSSLYFYAANFPLGKRLGIRFIDNIQKTGRWVFEEGTYDFYCHKGTYAMYSREEGNDMIDFYTHDGSGWVSIDWISGDKRKFKGRFEMTVYRDPDGAPLEITDGYFYIDMDKLDEEHSSGN